MANPSSPPPNKKRVKGESNGAAGLKQAYTTIKTDPKIATTQATGAWDNFTAHITQDDKNMFAKAREDLKTLREDTLRPEFRETYKD